MSALKGHSSQEFGYPFKQASLADIEKYVQHEAVIYI